MQHRVSEMKTRNGLLGFRRPAWEAAGRMRRGPRPGRPAGWPHTGRGWTCGACLLAPSTHEGSSPGCPLRWGTKQSGEGDPHSMHGAINLGRVSLGVRLICTLNENTNLVDGAWGRPLLSRLRSRGGRGRWLLGLGLLL